MIPQPNQRQSSFHQHVSVKNLIDEIYSTANSNNLHNRVILSPKNEHCLEINEKVLETIPEETRTFLSADFVKCDNEGER